MSCDHAHIYVYVFVHVYIYNDTFLYNPSIILFNSYIYINIYIISFINIFCNVPLYHDNNYKSQHRYRIAYNQGDITLLRVGSGKHFIINKTKIIQLPT